MKKIILALMTSLVIPLENAHAGTVEYAYPQYLKDQDNIIRLVREVRNIYMTTIGFPNLDTIDMRNLFGINPLTDSQLKEFKEKFKLTTKNKNAVAIIKYKATSCNNLENLKYKMLKETLITEGEPISCQNNIVTLELNN